MESLKHWTEESIDDFLYKISADFARQLENYLASTPNLKQKDLADRLGVSASRVSQVLNNPGNLTMRKCVQYARALGKKVAVVAYDDGDPGNVRGPVSSQIFEHCWTNAGRPSDFFALQSAKAVETYVITAERQVLILGQLSATQSNVSAPRYGTAQNAGTDAERTVMLGNQGAGTNG